MKRTLNFIGTLSRTDSAELKSLGASYVHDNDIPRTGGLNALLDHVAESQHISSNATNIFDPIYVVRPNRNSAHYLLEILAEFHKREKTVSVYHDDSDPECTPKERTDYEKSMEVLKTSGVRVFRSVKEAHDELNDHVIK